jgi:hypothetical protein
MDVCLLWVLCVVRYRSLRRTDHPSRGVLPTVARRVCSRNLEYEECKARYRAVKIQPQWVVTPGKQTYKQTNNLGILWFAIGIGKSKLQFCELYYYTGLDTTGNWISEAAFISDDTYNFVE